VIFVQHKKREYGKLAVAFIFFILSSAAAARELLLSLNTHPPLGSMYLVRSFAFFQLSADGDCLTK
jgi:hypothetical protein